MTSLHQKVTLIASIAALSLTACGQAPATTNRPRYGFATRTMQAARTMPAPRPQNSADEQDIGKNPFVIWIKQTHPQAAASIIDQYLSSGSSPNPDMAAESQRAQFRQQAIDQVAKELVKNLALGLPKGLTGKTAGPGRVRVTGYQKQFGFDIKLQFDFMIRMDKAGLIWITVPPDQVKAYAESSIVSLFDGDLDDNAYEEIVKNLDEQGPPNARKTPGLTYIKGGTFRLDPGFAFVNMPS